MAFESEIQLSRNLVVSLNFGHSFDDDFDEKRSRPASDLPHVRTEIISYLQATDNYLTSAKFDYFWSPRKEVFMKTSAGIFEMMYGWIRFLNISTSLLIITFYLVLNYMMLKEELLIKSLICWITEFKRGI